MCDTLQHQNSKMSAKLDEVTVMNVPYISIPPESEFIAHNDKCFIRPAVVSVVFLLIEHDTASLI